MKKTMLVLAIGLVIGIAVATTFSTQPNSIGTSANAHALDWRPAFIRNSGQKDAAVAFYASNGQGTVFVTHQGEIVHSLPARSGVTATPVKATVEEPASLLPRSHSEMLAHAQSLLKQAHQNSTTPTAGTTGWSITERFVQGHARIEGSHTTTSPINLIYGKNPNHWQHDAASYSTVTLGEVWPGVHVELRAHEGRAEKWFTVMPGADPRHIQVALRGAESLQVGMDGRLALRTGLGEVHFSKPLAFQQTATGKQAVEVAYVVENDRYGFRLGEHDTTLPVTIDPILQSTYLGGAGNDSAGFFFHPTNGDIYAFAITTASDFPGTGGGAQQTHAAGNNTDVYIARLSSDLTQLRNATYLGGSKNDTLFLGPASFLANGDLVLFGTTDSTDFPGTAGMAQTTLGGGIDTVVAIVSADLRTVRATYIGGDGDDLLGAGFTSANGFVDPTAGDILLAGTTDSTDFPNTNGNAQPDHGGGDDLIIVRLAGDLLDYNATYFGGSNNEEGFLTLGASNEFTFIGTTRSNDLPSTAGSFQPASGGGTSDCFMARIADDLSVIHRASYFGGAGREEGCSTFGLAAGGGEFRLVGQTTSTTGVGSTTGAAQTANGGGQDCFVSRISAELNVRTRTTFFGGPANETCAGVFPRDGVAGELYLTGISTGAGLPAGSAGAGAQPTFGGGGSDNFIARLSTDLSLIPRTTYLGGNDPLELGVLLPVTLDGDILFTYITQSTNLPGTAGSLQPAPHPGSPAGTANLDAYFGLLSGDLDSIQATFYGGSGQDGIVAIPTTNDDILLVGNTDSQNLAGTINGAQPALGGETDAFVALYEGDLSTIIQATYIGGSENDSLGVTRLSNGNFRLVGEAGPGLPGTGGGAQSAFGGGTSDFAVVVLNSTLRNIIQATYIGGTANETGASLFNHPTQSQVYVAGATNSQNFPGTSGGLQTDNAGQQDAVIACLTPDFSAAGSAGPCGTASAAPPRNNAPAAAPQGYVAAITPWTLLAIAGLLLIRRRI